MKNLLKRAGAPPKNAPLITYREQNLKEIFEAPTPELLPKAIERYLSAFVGGGYPRLSDPAILKIAARTMREATYVDVSQLSDKEQRKYFARNLLAVCSPGDDLKAIAQRLLDTAPDDIINAFIDQAAWQAENRFFGVFPERNTLVVMRHVQLSSLSDTLIALCQEFAPQIPEDWTVTLRDGVPS